MRNIRHINIEVDKQDFIKKLGIKDVDVNDIVNKVLEKIPAPQQETIDTDEIVAKVIKSLPTTKAKAQKINIDEIVANVLSLIKIPEPQIIEKVERVDITTDELVSKINTVNKEIDWKVLKNIPYDVLNKKGDKDHAIHRGGMTRFTQLLDVPQSYTGQSGNALRVKTDLTGLEFYTPSGDTDEKVKVSANDTTAGYLNGKLVAGSGITLTENNDGGDETLTVAFDNTGGYITGPTDSTLTETGDTLGINLSNANTWTGVQSYVVGDYRAYLGDIGGGYSFSANFGGINFAEFCSATLAANFSGNVNVNGDYYIGGSPIGVSHWANDAGYIQGATDTTLTESGDTLAINLANSNTWTVSQAVDDGAGNQAYLVNTGVGAGGSFVGTNYALSASTSGYSSVLASSLEGFGGYFADTFNSRSIILADGLNGYAANAVGNYNTTSDYYINGSPIPVSNWVDDGYYLTSSTGVTSLTGTANQVLVNGGSGTPTSGAITLTLPQSIATSSTPQFTRLGVGVAAAAAVQLKTTILSTGNRGLEINGIASQTGDYLTVLNNSGTKQFWVASTGAFGFGSGALAGLENSNLAPYLDVSSGVSPASIVMGAELNNVTRTNNTTKTGKFAGAPYTTTDKGIAIIQYNSTSSANTLYFGGGTSILQASTSQLFYTASAVNTVTGTQRLAIFGSGRIAMGDGLVEAYTARLAVIHTDTTTDSTLELRSMAAQTGNILSVRNSAGTLQAYLENTTNPNGGALLRVGRGSNYGNYQERAILGYYSPPDSAAGWNTNQAVIEGVLDVTNASTAFNTYGGYAMYYRVAKSGAGFVQNLSGAGGQVEITAGSGNIGSAHGYYSVYQNSSTNTVSEVFGIQSYFGQSAANTTTSLYGSQLWFAHSGSANVTNTYGYHLRNNMGTVGTMTNMYGFYMQDFTTKVTNTWGVYILGATTKNYFQGEVEMDGALNHDGTTVGFYGVTPVVQSSAYTVTNGTTDRTYDADATTVNELADVVATLIADLKATGIIG